MIGRLDEKHLDALITLLKPEDNLYVSESDWAEVEYRSRQAREGKVKMIPAQESIKRIKADLVKKSDPNEEYYVSEKDWKEAERRMKELRDGKVKMVPVEQAIKRIKTKLKKLKN